MCPSLDLEIYKQVVENCPDAVLILVEMKVVYANKKALTLYGGDSLEELIGQDALDFILPQTPRKSRAREFEAKRLQGESCRELLEVPAKLKDGRDVTLEVNICDISFKDTAGSLWVVRDVTTKKHLENRIQSLHVSAALLGKTTTVDDAAEIVLDALKGIFGMDYAGVGFVEGDYLTFKHVRGVSNMNQVPLDGPGVTVRAINTHQTQVVNDTTSDPDYLNGRVEGDKRTHSELDVPIIIDGKAVAVISIEENEPNSFDLEEVQLVEILGNHLTSALERIYRQNQLVEMREAHVMELVGGIDRMCYRMQEDLKGPIHNIRNSSFIIRHSPELAPEVVDNIDNSVELMMTTLEEMKEITNPTEPDKSITDIYQVLKAAIDLSNVPNNIQLVTGSEEDFLVINIDKDKIQRVFFNIIRNAIEAMPRGGTLTINHEIKNGSAVFCFKDTGKGISPEAMGHLYEPFFSTKPHSRGLGLSFCKLAVESNGGFMDIQSVVGEGTTVKISLPL